MKNIDCFDFYKVYNDLKKMSWLKEGSLPYKFFLEGEITNLKKVLEKNHICFSENSTLDEAIILGFETLGLDFFKMLKGDFFFIIEKNKKLYLIKGPTYKKTIYYEIDANKVLVYHSLSNVHDKRMKFMSFEESQTMNRIEARATNFRNVYSLGYHEVLIVNAIKNNYSLFALSDPSKNAIEFFDENLAVKKIKELFTDRFEQYGKKENSCAFVSGGIDSSIVAYKWYQNNKDMNLYSIGTESDNEYDYANILGKHIRKKVEYLNYESQEYSKALIETIFILEHSHSKIIEYMIPLTISYKKIPAGSVVVSGYGSDIIFGGFSNGNILESSELVLSELRSVEGSNEMSEKIDQYFDIEVCYPYFDTEILNLSYKISSNLKAKDSIEKYILRKSFEKDLPKAVTWRKKKGIHESTGCEKYFSEYVENEFSFLDNTRQKKEFLAYLIFEELFVNKKNIDEICLTTLLSKENN